MRTTRPQIEAAFRTMKASAIRAGVEDAKTWDLDYAPIYGGWCIERAGGSDSLGSGFMTANRMQAGAFYQMLRAMLDVFDRMPDGPEAIFDAA